MRRIINGRAYDTDTAIKLAEWQSDVKFETLYRKKNGEYFLLINDPCRTGTRIKSMSEAEAKRWVEDCSNEKYESIFGIQEE